ncbi:MAG TPA: outer membrane protein assembly factor [Gammaproteobacteria bacterium]|nr:outer membrane protein assembly factor [Gammaproteobacteria bacterium]
MIPRWPKRAILLLFLLLPVVGEAATPTLVIKGVEGEPRDNIEALVDVSRYPCDAPEWRFARIRQRAEKDAIKALHALGYYQAKLEIKRRPKPDCWALEIDVTPGPRTIISSIDIRIIGSLKDTPGYRRWQKHRAIKPGQPLSHADYEQLKQTIESLASQYGYLSGKFVRHALKIDKSRNRAMIDLVYDSGPRAKIGKVTVEQSQFRPRFVNKLIILKQGDPFDTAELTRQQAALNDSGYFSRVEIEVNRQAGNGLELPVKIKLHPRKRHAWRVGLGASTNEGPRVSLKFDNRWANRSGHSYVFDSRWSPVVSEGSLDYAIPLGDAGDHKLNLGLGSREERTDTSLSRTIKAGAKLVRTQGNGWKTISSLEFLSEDFTTADSEANVKLLMPGFGVSRSKRPSFLFPRSGWRIAANTQIAVEGLLSDLDFGQLTGSIKIIRPAARQSRILLRGGAGLSYVNDFPRLPASLRFYAGGDNSVRGFAYKSLGPKNDQDEVIGGKHFLSGSIEYETMVKQPWSVAFFVDAGNAFNHFDKYELKKSAGIGVRYHSPIGPIRLDLAHDLEGNGDAIRLHLSMGPDL